MLTFHLGLEVGSFCLFTKKYGCSSTTPVIHFSSSEINSLLVTMHSKMKNFLVHFVSLVCFIDIAINPVIGNLIDSKNNFSDTLHKVLPGKRCDSLLVSMPHVKGQMHDCKLSYFLKHNLL